MENIGGVFGLSLGRPTFWRKGGHPFILVIRVLSRVENQRAGVHPRDLLGILESAVL